MNIYDIYVTKGGKEFAAKVASETAWDAVKSIRESGYTGGETIVELDCDLLRDAEIISVDEI